MHDMFYYDCKDTPDMVSNHLDDHPYIALLNARQLTDLTPMEEDMILKHMWLPFKHKPQYKEGWALTIADKYHAVMDWVVVPVKKRMKKHAELYKRQEGYVQLNETRVY